MIERIDVTSQAPLPLIASRPIDIEVLLRWGGCQFFPRPRLMRSRRPGGPVMSAWGVVETLETRLTREPAPFSFGDFFCQAGLIQRSRKSCRQVKEACRALAAKVAPPARKNTPISDR